MTTEIDGTHHLRATPRYKLFQPTEIVVGAHVARAHLLNLSAGGALIFFRNPPALGTMLGVQCGERTLRARVAWAKTDRFGAAFLSPLTDQYVSTLIASEDAAIAAKAGKQAPDKHRDARLR